jgi:hypothetical protein
VRRVVPPGSQMPGRVEIAAVVNRYASQR